MCKGGGPSWLLTWDAIRRHVAQGTEFRESRSHTVDINDLNPLIYSDKMWRYLATGAAGPEYIVTQRCS